MYLLRFFVLSFAFAMSGCTTVVRMAHMHSGEAPAPQTFQYKDGGSGIYYSFTVGNTQKHTPVNPNVAAEGVPGFHHVKGPGGHYMAGMKLDDDEVELGRVDSGTGEQPGNLEETSDTSRNRPNPFHRKRSEETYGNSSRSYLCPNLR